MGVCIGLVPRGNQTLTTSTNIYFLDNRSHPLATSQKVCDAWPEQSEAKDRKHSVKHWSTPGIEQDRARRIWQSNSCITSPSWSVLKAKSAESTSWSWVLWHALLVVMYLRIWRSSQARQNLTTEFVICEFTVASNFGRRQIKRRLSENYSNPI